MHRTSAGFVSASFHFAPHPPESPQTHNCVHFRVKSTSVCLATDATVQQQHGTEAAGATGGAGAAGGAGASSPMSSHSFWQ